MLTLHGYLNNCNRKSGILTMAYIPGNELENGVVDHSKEALLRFVKREHFDIVPYRLDEFFVTSKYGITGDMPALISRQIKMTVSVEKYKLRTPDGKYKNAARLVLLSFDPVTNLKQSL